MPEDLSPEHRNTKSPGIIRRSFSRLSRWIAALRTLLSNLLFVLLLLFLITLFSDKELPSIPERGALVINPVGVLVDQPSYADPLRQLLGRSDPASQEVVLQDIVDAIAFAVDDPRITAVVLELDQLSHAGLSKMQEIASALQAVREAGKPIYAIGDSFSQDQYWLAAQADEIYMHPMGAVFLQGYGLYRNYFREALNKLEINFHVFRVGEYKSALEPFLRDDMSAAAKEANLSWLGSLWSQYREGVSAQRKLPAQALDQYINQIDQQLRQHGGNAAATALAAGLIDGIKTRDQSNDYLIARLGESDDEGWYSGVGFKQYLWLQRAQLPSVDHQPGVGLLVAEGNIVDGEQVGATIGGDSLAALIRQAREDERVAILVLRVNSGGGSAFASEIIRRELELFKQSGRKLVVSMGSMAASGGYWIAALADEIWATPATLTGSIGIFGAFPTVEKTLANLGVYSDGVGTTELAGALRIDRPLPPLAADALQLMIENGYEQFLDVVASGRNLSREKVAGIAQGRVWSGDHARQRGLVDQLGGLDQALDSAAVLAGLGADYQRLLIEPALSPQQRLLRELSAVLQPNWSSSAPVINSLMQRLQPVVSGLDYLAWMNDPRGVYVYCSSCSAL